MQGQTGETLTSPQPDGYRSSRRRKARLSPSISPPPHGGAKRAKVSSDFEEESSRFCTQCSSYQCPRASEVAGFRTPPLTDDTGRSAAVSPSPSNEHWKGTEAVNDHYLWANTTFESPSRESDKTPDELSDQISGEEEEDTYRGEDTNTETFHDEEKQPSRQPSSEPETSAGTPSTESSEIVDSNQSTEHDPTSEKAEGESEEERSVSDPLERLVRQNLAPEVADCYLKKTRGVIAYMPSKQVSSSNLQSLSLLEALQVDFRLTEYSPSITSTTFGPTSSESRKSIGSAGKDSTSDSGSSNQSNSRGDRGDSRQSQDDAAHKDKAGSADTPRVDVEPKSTVQGTAIHKFRCPFNARNSRLYCERVDPKFKRCNGNGWKNVQDVKAHVKKYHCKPAPETKPDLQCSRCQLISGNISDWENHDMNADCTIRCAECGEIFLSKSDRQMHRKEKHSKTLTAKGVIEILASDDKKIMDELKKFVNANDPSKTGQSVPQDAGSLAIRTWVNQNTEMYKIGRNDGNQFHDLGYWFILYTLAFPRQRIPNHPFVESASQVDDVEETLELILYHWNTILEAHLAARDPPPPTNARGYYTNILKEVLAVAKNTRFDPSIIGHIPRSDNTQNLADFADANLTESNQAGSLYTPNTMNFAGPNQAPTLPASVSGIPSGGYHAQSSLNSFVANLSQDNQAYNLQTTSQVAPVEAQGAHNPFVSTPLSLDDSNAPQSMPHPHGLDRMMQNVHSDNTMGLVGRPVGQAMQPSFLNGLGQINTGSYAGYMSTEPGPGGWGFPQWTMEPHSNGDSSPADYSSMQDSYGSS